jgi:hypothetical protein
MTLLGNRSDRLTKPLFHILEVTRLIRYAGKSTSLSVDGGVVVGEGIFRFLIRQSVTSSFKLSVAVRTFSSSSSRLSGLELGVEPDRFCRRDVLSDLRADRDENRRGSRRHSQRPRLE